MNYRLGSERAILVGQDSRDWEKHWNNVSPIPLYFHPVKGDTGMLDLKASGAQEARDEQVFCSEELLFQGESSVLLGNKKKRLQTA